MTDKELINIIQEEQSDQQLIEIQELLESELSKPITQRNYERIDELIREIEHITGEDQITSQMEEQGLKKIRQRIEKNRKSKIRLIRRLVGCACAVLIISNIWSYKTYGINSFSAAYQIMSGGIKIDFSVQDSEGYEEGNPYEEKMRNICDELSIDAKIPTYIPYGFQPTDNFGSYFKMENEIDLNFSLKNQNQQLTLCVVQFFDTSDIPPLGIASDHHHITEQVINGTNVHISKEDQQYTAAFMINRTQYILSTDKVDYDDCYHILVSMLSD